MVGSVGVEPMTSTMSKPPFINKNNIKNGLFRCGYMKFQGMLEGLIRVSSSQIIVFWGLMMVIHGLIVVNESESRVFCEHSAFSFVSKQEVRLSGHFTLYNAVTRLREATKT